MVQGQDLELKSIEWSIHGREENIQKQKLGSEGTEQGFCGIREKTSGIKEKRELRRVFLEN